jgi:hypothetical protein
MLNFLDRSLSIGPSLDSCICSGCDLAHSFACMRCFPACKTEPCRTVAAGENYRVPPPFRSLKSRCKRHNLNKVAHTLPGKQLAMNKAAAASLGSDRDRNSGSLATDTVSSPQTSAQQLAISKGAIAKAFKEYKRSFPQVAR